MASSIVIVVLSVKSVNHVIYQHKHVSKNQPLIDSRKMLSFAGLICLFCNSVLKEDKKKSCITIYTQRGSFSSSHITKACPNLKCQSRFHYSHFTLYQDNFSEKKLSKYYYDDSLNKQYFMSSACTAFETEFLRSFYTDMFLTPEYSFHQKCTSFNISVASGNFSLNPKRFTEAFFQISMLDLLKFLKKEVKLSKIKLSHDVDLNIEKLLPELKEEFRRYYSQHRCDINGCQTVIGFDADAKVRKYTYVIQCPISEIADMN